MLIFIENLNNGRQNFPYSSFHYEKKSPKGYTSLTRGTSGMKKACLLYLRRIKRNQQI